MSIQDTQFAVDAGFVAVDAEGRNLAVAGNNSDFDHWPAEARLIMSAIQAGAAAAAPSDRRGGQRANYQVRGELRLFSDPDGSAPWQIYTRDVSSRSAGFITPHRLPLGYGGIVELPAVDGQLVTAHCTLFRCRQTAQGWYEGALSFHRPQWTLLGETESQTNE